MSEFAPYVVKKNPDPVCDGNTGWIAVVIYEEDEGTGTLDYIPIYNPKTIEVDVLVSEVYVKNDQDRIDELNKQLVREPYEIIRVKDVATNIYLDKIVYTSSKAKQIQAEISKLTPGRWDRKYEKRTIPNPNYIPEKPTDNSGVIVLNDFNRKTQWISYGSRLVGLYKDKQNVVELSQSALSVKFLFCGCGNNEIECGDCCASCCNIAQLVHSIFV